MSAAAREQRGEKGGIAAVERTTNSRRWLYLARYVADAAALKYAVLSSRSASFGGVACIMRLRLSSTVRGEMHACPPCESAWQLPQVTLDRALPPHYF